MADITAAHYFAGTIGLAMIRHWYRDGARNDALLSELQSLLDHRDDFPNSLVLDPEERDLTRGYAEWAGSYDGPNPLIDAEEPVVHPVLDALVTPGCSALDAACGTGRHARYLAGQGARVTGVDRSPAMLEVARREVPEATFDDGELESLPYQDGSFDLAVVSLALCHLADPAPAVAELGRVLTPGGHLVITDPHPMGNGMIGGQAFYGGIAPGRPMTWVRNHYHLASTWFDAFGRAGLQVAECRELPFTDEQLATTPAAAVHPEAARTAMEELPSLWLWVVERPSS